MDNHGISFDVSDEKKPHFGKPKDDKVTLVWLYKKINSQGPIFVFPYISLTISCF